MQIRQAFVALGFAAALATMLILSVFIGAGPHMAAWVPVLAAAPAHTLSSTRSVTMTLSHSPAQTPYSHPKLDLSQHPAGIYRGPLRGWWHFSESNITSPTCTREFRVPKDSDVGSWRRFKPAAIARCLANKDIVFVGDDVMYQLFLSLVIQLSTGKPANPLNPPDARFASRLVNGDMALDAAQWLSWECDFANGFACDFDFAHGVHNVYYHSREHHVNVSFIAFRYAGYGHAPMGTAWMMQEGGEPHPGFGEESNLAWEDATLPQLARVIAQGLPPLDHLFVNSGVLQLEPPVLDSVESARNALKPFMAAMKPGAVPTWLTTTVNYGHVAELTVPALSSLLDMAPATRAALDLDWRVLDRGAMTKTLFLQLKRMGCYKAIPAMHVTDTEHQPYVVMEFLNALLNMVCE